MYVLLFTITFSLYKARVLLDVEVNRFSRTVDRYVWKIPANDSLEQVKFRMYLGSILLSVGSIR